VAVVIGHWVVRPLVTRRRRSLQATQYAFERVETVEQGVYARAKAVVEAKRQLISFIQAVILRVRAGLERGHRLRIAEMGHDVVRGRAQFKGVAAAQDEARRRPSFFGHGGHASARDADGP
jgi:hypothetical protein